MIGNVIGSNYKIVAKLGEGGMGAVYKGVDMMLEREVAIKALRPELASQTQVVERFRSEAVTLAKLNHPNIATLFNFFRQGDEFYMVLEFVRGVTLDNLIAQRGALPVNQAVPLFCKVLDGIDHAHEMGIVHRDIKPANMMLTDKGALKVLDFGIARILGTARMTKAGHLIGTVEYMPPEQVKGLETDARSDIYSLGMLLYEMLTGRTAFDIQNEFELMSAQISQMPTLPRELNPHIPVEVEQAIMRAIAKDPSERFQTAGDFRAVLLSAGLTSIGTLEPFTGGINDPRVITRLSDLALNTTPPVSLPPTPTPATGSEGLKETRLGVAGMAPSLATGAGAKETRLSTVPSLPPAYQQAASGSPQASFFSKLTPIHYIGAGIAVLVVFGLLIAAPLMLLGGSNKPSAAAPVATKPAVESPATPSAANDQPSVGTLPSAGGDVSPASNQTTIKTDTAPLQASDLKVGSTEKASSKPAAKPAAPAKPKVDTAAAEAKRRRDAALKALDQ